MVRSVIPYTVSDVPSNHVSKSTYIWFAAEHVRLRRAITIDEDADPAALEKAGRLEGHLKYKDGREVSSRVESDGENESSEPEDDVPDVQPAKKQKGKAVARPASPSVSAAGSSSRAFTNFDDVRVNEIRENYYQLAQRLVDTRAQMEMLASMEEKITGMTFGDYSGYQGQIQPLTSLTEFDQEWSARCSLDGYHTLPKIVAGKLDSCPGKELFGEPAVEE